MRADIGTSGGPITEDDTLLLFSRSRPDEAPDITLLNLNLMHVNLCHAIDRQAYLPLGLLYLAACLERCGYNVELVDYQNFVGAPYFNAELFVEGLAEPAPIIGISCMSNLLPFSVHLARRLKSAYPDRRIVLGGVGPSPVAREIVRVFPFIDSVVEGEGEISIVDIMRGRRDRYISSQPPEELDALPLPAYSLVDFNLYDAAPSVITSRGCPYGCSFCTEPYNFGGHGVRFRDVESVLREIELIHELSGRKMFLFQDDILPLDRPRFHRLAAGLRNLSFDITWKCFGRIDLMTEDVLTDMAQSGCVQVRYGIESGSNTTLDRIHKGFRIEQAYDVACRSLKYFPSVHASFIWGYPFEEVPEFEETLQWISRFEDAGITVLLFEFSPLPGSPLYREHQEQLSFSRESYPSYVITGHEEVREGRYATGSALDPVYQLIADHPRIFSGFYRYQSAIDLAKRERLDRFRPTGRTAIRNEYDL